MKKKLTIAFLFCFTLISYSQKEVYEFFGKILEFQKPIEGVHIYNLNKLTGTTTNKNGDFNIIVSINDTLLVSHVKYKNKRITISKEDLEKGPPYIIFIEEMTNYLETVTVKNHSLTGNLTLDSKNSPRGRNLDSISFVYNKLAKMRSTKNYGIDFEKPPINNVDPTAMGGVGGGAGIGFRFKDLEERKALKNKRDFPKKIISDFGVDYFTNTLKIPKEKINNFLTYCDSKNIMSLYNQNEIMAVITILHTESIEYLKIDD